MSIGQFCQIAADVEIVMYAVNHQMNVVSTFPFYTLEGWGVETPDASAMPFMDRIYTSAENKWEQVSVALGMAEYDPQHDTSVDDVIHRADKTMYENKRTNKRRGKSDDNLY